MSTRTKRKLSKRELTMRCISQCSAALSHYYRHDGVMHGDMRTVLGVLFALHIQGGDNLQLTVKER